MELRSVEYQARFREQCVALISDTWNFNRLFPELKKDNLVNELFFDSALIGENSSQVIVDENDCVYGYVFGNIAQKHRPFWHNAMRIISLFLKVSYHLVKGSFGSRKEFIQKIQEFAVVEKKIMSKKAVSDAYVHLFFVSSKLRGQGWGKKLMNSFIAECRGFGAPRLYLYTDLGCNYAFYDHTGFTRTVELHSPFFDRPEEKVNGFAYVQDLL